MDSSGFSSSSGTSIDGDDTSSKSTAKHGHHFAAESKCPEQDLVELFPALVALAQRSLYDISTAITEDLSCKAGLCCFRWVEAALNIGMQIVEGSACVCVQHLSSGECSSCLTDAQLPAIFVVLTAVCELTAAARPHHSMSLHSQLATATALVEGLAHASDVMAARLVNILSSTLRMPQLKRVLLTSCHIGHLYGVIIAYSAAAGHCTVAPAGDASFINPTLSVSAGRFGNLFGALSVSLSAALWLPCSPAQSLLPVALPL